MKNPLTPKEFEKRMQAAANSRPSGGVKRDHMDRLMVDLLVALGYGEGIEVFRRSEKWYP